MCDECFSRVGSKNPFASFYEWICVISFFGQGFNFFLDPCVLGDGNSRVQIVPFGDQYFVCCEIDGIVDDLYVLENGQGDSTCNLCLGWVWVKSQVGHF